MKPSSALENGNSLNKEGHGTQHIGGKQYLAVVAGRSKGPPSFFGKIGQRVVDASPEGGILAVFELGN